MTRLLLCLLLAGCAHERIVYRPVPVPAGLLQPVTHPIIPDPQTATQRDVALLLIEQHQALAVYQARLTAIATWSSHWTSPTKPMPSSSKP